MGVPLKRAMLGGGVFCPACHTHVVFTDDRAGLRAADRNLANTLAEMSQTITIELRL
jgi:hypothetical protein